MDWNPKTPLHWDWDSLGLFSGKESDITKPTATATATQQQEWRPQGIGNGSIGFGGACSGSGSGSSKSSVSDSSAKAAAAAGGGGGGGGGGANNNNNNNNKISDFNFEAAEPPFSSKPCNKNKEELARVEYTGTSKEPLIGLKLGKRTYFEDVCPGSNSKNSSSSSAPPPTPLANKSRMLHQGTQSFHCQVEGCNDDLTTAKDYHRKHRVCERHSKCPKVIVAGQERRFCQQCSRFHDLSEFDQKKRSCRRRLSDHNARRRKPQPDTISFNSSRLSSPFHDYGPQMSFLLNRAPFGYTRPAASSDASGFKLSQMKESWVKSPKGGGINGQLHFPSTELPNTVSLRHDLDSLLPFKGTTAEVLNQGLEATVAASNLDGAPDFRRALSLLSTDAWGPDPGLTHAPFVNANHASSARPGLHMVNSTAECWPDESLAQQARVLPLDLHAHASQFQEFQLLKAPYEASFFDSSQMR